MAHVQLETIPATWSDERDGAFFRLVGHVLAPDFVSGATALLTSYDEDTPTEPSPVPRPVPWQRTASRRHRTLY